MTAPVGRDLKHLSSDQKWWWCRSRWFMERGIAVTTAPQLWQQYMVTQGVKAASNKNHIEMMAVGTHTAF